MNQIKNKQRKIYTINQQCMPCRHTVATVQDPVYKQTLTQKMAMSSFLLIIVVLYIK